MVVERFEDGVAGDGRWEGGRGGEDGALHGCDWDLGGILYKLLLDPWESVYTVLCTPYSVLRRSSYNHRENDIPSKQTQSQKRKCCSGPARELQEAHADVQPSDVGRLWLRLLPNSTGV